MGAAKSFSRIIMSIYFLCFASGLLILFAGGCGGSSKADVEFMRQVEQTKAHYSASEIRKSALKLLGRQKGDEAIPGEIKSLPIFQEEGKTFISVIPMENAKGLIFSDGGGFSGQGIIVCLSEDAITNIVIHGTVLRWEQGVYFWTDWRVTHGVSQSELVLRRE